MLTNSASGRVDNCANIRRGGQLVQYEGENLFDATCKEFRVVHVVQRRVEFGVLHGGPGQLDAHNSSTNVRYLSV